MRKTWWVLNGGMAAVCIASSLLGAAALAQPLAEAPAITTAASSALPLSPDARAALTWVLAARDHQERPFAVVDKRQARMYVFDAQGQLLGVAPVLLGLALGDSDAPGVGLRPVAQIGPAERITPAGRFNTEPGRSLQGDDNIWFDYAAGLAIHRVRAGASQGPRQQRLAAGVASAQRASFGCVVVAPAFYDAVLLPTLGTQRGVVYVLPETRSVQALLAALSV